MNWFKKTYNKKSAKKHGWHPSWFASFLIDFNEELLDEIVKFQVDHDLKPDGLVGPVTFRRLLASRELAEVEQEASENFLLIDGRHVPIEWDTKIDLIKPGAFKKSRKTRKPNMIVTHWDACTSIGIDLSNAYYTKYNKVYTKRGFSKRPVLKNSYVHGRKLKPHLGYYGIQIEAYKKLLEALCKHYDIPLEAPEENGKLLTGVHNDAATGKFNGVVCHYHVTRKKIDCAGLELKKILDSLC